MSTTVKIINSTKNWAKKEWKLGVKTDYNFFTRTFVELLAAFFITLLLLFPGSWNLAQTKLSNPMEVINEINFLMPLWIVTISTISITTFRRFGIFLTPIAVVMRRTERKISFGYAIFISIIQLGGALIASMTMVYIMMAAGIWYPTISTPSALTPTVRGSLVSWNGSINLYGENWFYFFQYFVAFLTFMSAIVANKIISSKNITDRNKNLTRIVLFYIIAFVAIRFSAHNVNTWRVLAPAVMGVAYGGANQLATAWAIVGGHITAYILYFTLYNSRRFKEI